MTFANLMLITFNQMLFLKITHLEQGKSEAILGLRADEVIEEARWNFV